jgi:replicative DNA helicase
MEERTNENFVLMAQMQVLKILIENPDVSIKDITSDSFHNPKFKAYYTALQNLRETGEEVNETSLFREANRK